MPTEQQKRQKVTVVVPSESKWAAGQKWNGGRTEAELTDDQIATIAARDDVHVYVGGKRAKAVPLPPTTPVTETLQPDEAQVLREYRAKKAEDPKVAEKYGGPEVKKYELVTEDSGVAPKTSIATGEPQPIVSDDRAEAHPKRK